MSAAVAGDPAPWREAWSEALGELELDVERAEATLAGLHRDHSDSADQARGFPAGSGSGSGSGAGAGAGAGAAHSPWQPPTLSGPIPDDLVERARALLARQREVGRLMAVAMTTSRRHLAVVERLSGPAARPMYVDRAL